MNLLTHLFRWGSGHLPDDSPPAREEFPAPPPEAPPLSCFAAGLIKSMRDEPKLWRPVKREILCYGKCDGFATDSLFICHVQLHGLYVSSGASLLYISEDLGYDLKSYEQDAVSRAMHTYLIVPRHEAQQAKIKARQARLKAPFEQLGCPPTGLPRP